MDKSLVLDKNDTLAMMMRYEGKTHAEIAKVLGLSLQAIDRWFMTGGRLQTVYQKYALERNQEIRDETSKILKKHLSEAAQAIVDVMNSKNPSLKLAAAKELLDRELGKAVQPTLTGDLGKEYIDEWKYAIGIDEGQIERTPVYPKGTGSIQEMDVGNIQEDILPISAGSSGEDISSVPSGSENGGGS